MKTKKADFRPLFFTLRKCRKGFIKVLIKLLGKFAGSRGGTPVDLRRGRNAIAFKGVPFSVPFSSIKKKGMKKKFALACGGCADARRDATAEVQRGFRGKASLGSPAAKVGRRSFGFKRV